MLAWLTTRAVWATPRRLSRSSSSPTTNMKRTTPTSARSFRVPSELEGKRDKETAAQSGRDDHDDDLREQRAEGGRGAGIECRGGRRSGRASLIEALPMAED